MNSSSRGTFIAYSYRSVEIFVLPFSMSSYTLSPIVSMNPTSFGKS